MKKRVGIWIRVSTEDQAEGDSPKLHEHRAQAYAEMKDWKVVEVYHLEAVSGKSVINHPEAKRMIEDVRRGHITGLIFSKLARLARNTKELLEFADIFRQYDADLMSLDESIDTSSPVGRFFYTLIAAMAEWERGEIASRVKASVGTRAKLGKSLGGEAPFGYRWENKELVLDSEEAPIRKLVHELFVKHKRKRTVAQILNEQGYSTRRGKFTDTSIDRMLRDPIAKGMRRINYTESTGDKKKWKLKPSDEWVFIDAPRIISDELWDTCNQILEEMGKKVGKVRRKGIHLFSGIVECYCGTKMYMRTLSPKYVCPKCRNKVEPDVLEEIFHGQLENFLFSDTEIQKHLDQEKQMLVSKEELLESRKKELAAVKQRISNLLDLYNDGELSRETFREHHAPLNERQRQIEESIMELQTEVDALNMQTLSNSQILHDAQSLQRQWHTFTPEEKRSIIETITTSIIVGKEDIEINLSYIPAQIPKTNKSVNCSIGNSTAKHCSYAMQGCPCGYYNHPEKECVCGPGVVKRYVSKISGPLLDRIDLHVEVTPVSYDELTTSERPKLTSAEIRQRVLRARAVQAGRFKDLKDVYCNAQMPSRMVREVCALDSAGLTLLKTSMERLQLSARAYDRILKVARTAADLGGSDAIRIEDLAEAIHFRSLDREGWAG